VTQAAFEFTPVPNVSVDPRDRARLSKQCVRLLERLQRGPVTNVEGVTELRLLNMTARVSEVRQAGYDVRATRTSEPGVWVYSLAVSK
jgi:hypothetical protein